MGKVLFTDKDDSETGESQTEGLHDLARGTVILTPSVTLSGEPLQGPKGHRVSHSILKARDNVKSGRVIASPYLVSDSSEFREQVIIPWVSVLTVVYLTLYLTVLKHK